MYDAQPELTRGCAAAASCRVFFPIQELGAPDGVGVVYVRNDEDEPQDVATGSGGGSRSLDSSRVSETTYGVRTGPLGPAAAPVPLSRIVGSGVVLGAGLIAVRTFARG